MGKAIVQWNGPQSNRREKLKVILQKYKVWPTKKYLKRHNVSRGAGCWSWSETLSSSPLFAGGLVGSGHPGQGERGSSSDRRGGGRRWAGLPRAHEGHDGGARPKEWAAEGGHPRWQAWPGAEHQRQALPVRTLFFFFICCIIAAARCERFGLFDQIIHMFFFVFSPQRFWKQRESGGSRSGHAASYARPAALLCNCLLILQTWSSDTVENEPHPIVHCFSLAVRTVTWPTREAPVWWCGKANRPPRKSGEKLSTGRWWVHEMNLLHTMVPFLQGHRVKL